MFEYKKIFLVVGMSALSMNVCAEYRVDGVLNTDQGGLYLPGFSDLLVTGEQNNRKVVASGGSSVVIAAANIDIDGGEGGLISDGRYIDKALTLFSSSALVNSGSVVNYVADRYSAVDVESSFSAALGLNIDADMGEVYGITIDDNSSVIVSVKEESPLVELSEISGVYASEILNDEGPVGVRLNNGSSILVDLSSKNRSSASGVSIAHKNGASVLLNDSIVGVEVTGGNSNAFGVSVYSSFFAPPLIPSKSETIINSSNVSVLSKATRLDGEASSYGLSHYNQNSSIEVRNSNLYVSAVSKFNSHAVAISSDYFSGNYGGYKSLSNIYSSNIVVSSEGENYASAYGYSMHVDQDAFLEIIDSNVSVYSKGKEARSTGIRINADYGREYQLLVDNSIITVGTESDNGYSVGVHGGVYGGRGEISVVNGSQIEVFGSQYSAAIDAIFSRVNIDSTSTIKGDVYAESVSNNGVIAGVVFAFDEINNRGSIDGYSLSDALNVFSSGELVVSLSDKNKIEQEFFVADRVVLFDGATIRVRGSSSDYTSSNDWENYIIVSADQLVADESKLNLVSDDLLDLKFINADSNLIVVSARAKNLSDLVRSYGGSVSTSAAAASLQEIIKEFSGETVGDDFYQLAVNLSGREGFSELSPMVENISGQSIRSSDAQAANQVGNLLQNYRGGASGDDMPMASGFWLQGLRSDGEQSRMGDASGFEVKTKGYALGADVELMAGLTTGFAISYAESQADIEQSLDRQNSDGYTGSLYGQYLFDNDYYGSAIASYGQADNDSQRWIESSFAEAEFDSDIASLRLATGKKIWLDQWLLQPRAEYNFSDINIDSYVETGSLAALSVDKQSYKISELGFGGSIGRDFNVANTVLRPELQAMYYHDFQQDGVLITSAFTAGGSNFVTTGADPDAERYNVKLAVSWIFSDNQSLRASYDYNASDNFSGNTWLMDYRYDF